MYLESIQITKVFESPLKRVANIVEFYKDILFELFEKTSIKNIVNNLFPEGAIISQFTQNTLNFHRDPPHHLIGSDTLLGAQFCILLTDFTKENGATIFLNEREEHVYLTGQKGNVFWWKGTTLHSEGVNLTDKPRSCLLLNVQSINAPRLNHLLGFDEPIISFDEQCFRAFVNFSF